MSEKKKPVIIGLGPHEKRHSNNEPSFLFAKHTRRIFDGTAENFAKLPRLERNRRHGYTVMVGQTNTWYPLSVVQGAQPGPTVVITAGIHAGEYVGIKAALELSYELDFSAMCGTIIIVPLANTSGFWRRGTSMVAETERNLNRLFPGNPTPSAPIDERLAASLFALISTADYYCDLHSGDTYEALVPHAYYCEGLPSTPRTRELLQAIDMQYLVPYGEFHAGAAYARASFVGIPSILLERGGMGTYTTEEVEACKADVYALLRAVGALHDENNADATAINRPEQQVLTNQHFEYASVTGFWECFAPAGSTVKKGQLLGTITDPFGNTLDTLIAKDDGVVLYVVESLNIIQGELAIAYAGE